MRSSVVLPLPEGPEHADELLRADLERDAVEGVQPAVVIREGHAQIADGAGWEDLVCHHCHDVGA